MFVKAECPRYLELGNFHGDDGFKN
jgi:hypothetical protein